MVRADREVVRERLERLLSEIDAIEHRLPPRIEEYVAPENEGLRYELEHRMYIALQSMLDVAMHLAITNGAEGVGSYRAAMEALVALGVLEPALGRKLAGAPGLRNALAHEYAALDHERVYGSMVLTSEIRRFAAAVWTSLNA